MPPSTDSENASRCSRASCHRVGVELGLVTDLRAVGEEHREAAVLAGRRASMATVELLGSRIDGQDRGERGLVVLGVGDGAVARHVAHEERERDGERGDEQGGDGQRDEEEAAPHRWAALRRPGCSSLMPTPRTVWR